jgi:signal transduction histidine kinase
MKVRPEQSARQRTPHAPLTLEQIWWWIAVSAFAIANFSVSVPVIATVYQVPVLAAFAVGILQTGSVVLSLLAPRLSIAAWVAGTALFLLFGTPTPGAPWPLDVTGLLSLCALLLSLGLRRPIREGVIGWALGVGTSVAILLFVGVGAIAVGSVGGVVANLVTTTAISAFVLLLAILIAQRGQMRGELAEEQQRRGLVEERNRIARELHDVVAHSMSVIQVQASTAPYRLPSLDDAARAEFGDIASSARSAMQEMRQLLGVLRSERTTAEAMPQPGIAQIVDLAPSLERAGIAVTIDIDPSLPSTGVASTAAFRIVQESLSNVVRHAPGAAARVSAHTNDGSIVLTIENDAPAAAPPVSHTPGHGLIGMRERCVLLGGTLDAGPTPSGGYRVVASLPTASSARPPTPEFSGASNDKDPARP